MPAFDDLEPTTTEPEELDTDLTADDTGEESPESIPSDDEGAEALTGDDQPTDGVELPPDAPPQAKEYVREGRRFVPKAAEPAKAPEPPAPSPVIPWQANVYGETRELIPGAKFHPDHGLLIPKDQIGLAQALMARGTKYDDVKKQRQEFASERQRITEASRFEADRLVDALTKTALNAEWVQMAAIDPERAQWELRSLLREAQLDLKEKYGNVMAPPTTEPTQPEIDPYDAEVGVSGWVAEMLDTPDYHGLFADSDKAQIVAALVDAAVTVHEGQMVIDQLVATQLLNAMAEAPRREARVRAELGNQGKVKAIASRNAASVPNPTGARKPVPKVTPQSKTFDGKPWNDPSKSREERAVLYRKHMTGLSYA